MKHNVLVQYIQDAPNAHKRKLIALAGPPASGKSTLATDLAKQIPACAVVPMDGFHLDNSVLQDRGLQDRKGAPETFDVAGFTQLLESLRTDDTVTYPTFDRKLDRAIVRGGNVGPDITTVIVEGNYLLLDAPKWRDLMPIWDCSIYLSVPENVLRKRLIQRWRRHEYSEEQARAKVEGNDMKNAMLIANHLLQPQITLEDGRLER